MIKYVLPQAQLRRMMKLCLFQTLLAIICTSVAFAAKAPNSGTSSKKILTAATVDRTLTGKVTDETNSALPGVSIVLKGTQRGTVTDAEGQYKIEIPESGATLVYSFVGYLSQEVTV